jgi:hypothetical protein
MHLSTQPWDYSRSFALPDGKLTQETWDKLLATSASPVLITYELTRKDMRGPFT